MAIGSPGATQPSEILRSNRATVQDECIPDIGTSGVYGERLQDVLGMGIEWFDEHLKRAALNGFPQ